MKTRIALITIVLFFCNQNLLANSNIDQLSNQNNTQELSHNQVAHETNTFEITPDIDVFSDYAELEDPSLLESTGGDDDEWMFYSSIGVVVVVLALSASLATM